jgi:uncharacterized membrane protein
MVTAPARRLPLPAILLALWALCLVLLPFRIGTIYSGLPAHPLFLHVPVVFIPLTGLAALVVAVRPRYLERYGVALALTTIATLAGTILTADAGSALRRQLRIGGGGGFGASGFGPGGGGEASLIARHASAGHMVEYLMMLFTLAIIGSVLLVRRREGGVLRIVSALLGVACIFFVVKAGDLGAKAVWQGRLGGNPPSQGGTGFGSP